MSPTPEILVTDEEDPREEWKDTGAASRSSARRSLERLMERRALQRRLQDTFDEPGSAWNDPDWERPWR
ncbi:MAG: PA3496 family putative envelope integrity protein [Ectothiorhodospira sp.]